MIKLLLSILVLATVAGAAAKTVTNPNYLEDTFTLYALDAQVRQKYNNASEYFAELYKQTSKKEYLYQTLRMLEQAGDTKVLVKKTASALSKFPDDVTLQRFEIIGLLKGGNFGEASQKGLLLSNKTQKASDYLLYGEARLKLSDYEGTVEALKKAYALTYDDATAERIALIQYAQLGEKSEAIAFLKEHIGTHGNSKIVGKRLASLYADSGKFDDAAQTYEQTYEIDSDPAIAEEAIKVYAYQQNLVKMSEMLEKSHINDPLLLDIYVRNKVFDKASALAQKLYDLDSNPLYLAQSSVYMYEAAKNKDDKVMVDNVIDGLKKATKDLDDPLYLNYLGYLMIDHDLNITEGMGYVKRALEKQPDSPFYIDSLAWGNYKLGECAEALRLMKQVESMIGSEEDEVKEHIKAIEACKTKEKQ
jgi:tetratricopeptide (TPR) repeat protein